MKKQSNLSRLLDYAGTYRILTYLSWAFVVIAVLTYIAGLMCSRLCSLVYFGFCSSACMILSCFDGLPVPQG